MFKNYLWAKSRSKWVKHKVEGCIFCGIAKRDPKIFTKLLYMGKDFMVIMNIFPYNTGHLQVIPKRHVETLEELNENEFRGLFEMTKKVIRLIDKALKPAGYNIGINMGGDIAGGSIRHLHVQIVPRYPRDAGFMETTAETKVMPETLDETFGKLKKHVKMLEK
ncbi:MAG: HIT domain-containing protein [Candidatus Aenigmarchaeota archaeon]|nr:HIT domain-containing protein [Candidatus Aenigmarchaeota archaeon]